MAFTIFMWVYAQLLQLCLTLCDPMDCSPPGFSVHGILQARILEWVAVPSIRWSSWPRDQTQVSCISCITGGFFTAKPPGKPPYVCRDIHMHWALCLRFTNSQIRISYGQMSYGQNLKSNMGTWESALGLPGGVDALWKLTTSDVDCGRWGKCLSPKGQPYPISHLGWNITSFLPSLGSKVGMRFLIC